MLSYFFSGNKQVNILNDSGPTVQYIVFLSVFAILILLIFNYFTLVLLTFNYFSVNTKEQGLELNVIKMWIRET